MPIIVPSKRILTSQPQGNAVLDTSDESYKYLIAGTYGYQNVNLSNNALITPGSGISRGVNASGESLSFSGSQSSGAFNFSGSSSRLANASEIVIVTIFKITDLVIERKIVTAWPQGILLSVTPAGTIQFAWNADDNINLMTSPGITQGVDYSLCVRWRPGSAETKFYLDGKELSVSFQFGSPGTGINTNAPDIQLGIASDGNPHAGTINLALVYANYRFNDARLLDISSNPWQLFQSSQLIFTKASAGGTTGTLVTTNANDTVSATGTTQILGVLAKTNVNDSLAASGTTNVVGTLAKTNANDSLAASGTTTVAGTLTKTNANDSLAASGTTTIVGSLAKTNANDTLDAFGAGSPTLEPIPGDVDYTNANDTLAASGTTTLVGSLGYTNANDTSTVSGTTTLVGSLAKTNANDTLAASGVLTVVGALAKTNANDNVFASGFVGTQPKDFIDWILYAHPGNQVIVNQKTR